MVFYITIVKIWMTFFINKWTHIFMDDGWVHPLTKTLPSLVNNLWWNFVTVDWNLDEKSLGKCQELQHHKSIISLFLFLFTRNDKECWYTFLRHTFSFGFLSYTIRSCHLNWQITYVHSSNTPFRSSNVATLIPQKLLSLPHWMLMNWTCSWFSYFS
jgi:hypothetical protein